MIDDFRIFQSIQITIAAKVLFFIIIYQPKMMKNFTCIRFVFLRKRLHIIKKNISIFVILKLKSNCYDRCTME